MTLSRPMSYRYFGTALLALFGFTVAAPLALLYSNSLFVDGQISFEAYRTVLLDARQWTLLARSLTVALSVTGCATLLGSGAAFALARTAGAFRGTCLFLLTLPVLVPQHIMAIAWVDLLGRNGHLAQFVRIALPGAPAAPSPFTSAGAIFILAVTIYPIPLLATFAGLARFDDRFKEAALVAGQRKRIATSIVLPLVLPATLTGSALVFAMTLSTFSVPSLLLVNTYPVEIHASSTAFEYGAAAAQSLPLLALCAIVFASWSAYVRPRHAWLSGARRENRYHGPIRQSLASQLILCLSVLVLFVAPMAALFVRSLPLRTYGAVWSTAGEEIVNGVFTAFCSATAIVPAAFALRFAAVSRATTSMVRGLALMAFIVPGPLLALGLIAVWNRPGPFGAVYDTLSILVLACFTRFFAIAECGFASGLTRLDPRIKESTAAAGVSWWRDMLFVTAPLLFPYFAVLWVLSFVFSLGEVDASVMLCPPGKSTFAVRLFSLMHYGPDSFVAALSLLTALAVSFAVLLAVLAVRFAVGREHRHHA